MANIMENMLGQEVRITMGDGLMSQSQLMSSYEVADESGAENIQDETSGQAFDPKAIVEMAFNPTASLKPTQSVLSASGRPRKPRKSLTPTRYRDSTHQDSQSALSLRQMSSVRTPRPFNDQDYGNLQMSSYGDRASP